MRTPANGAETLPNRINFQWSESHGADSYQLQLDTDPSFRLPFRWDTQELSAVLEVLEGTQYYWRVIARNAWGERMASEGRYFGFRTAKEEEEEPPPEKPGPFQLVQPPDGMINAPIQPQFRWTQSVHADEYALYLGKEKELNVEPMMIWEGTLYTVPALDDNTTYYWNVQARNSEGEVWASDKPYSFTTLDLTPEEYPGTFQLAYPINKQGDVPRTLHLRWHRSEHAEGYRVYFGTEPNPPFVADTIGNFYYPGFLDPLTTYYWRVVAVNEFGEMEGSNGMIFSFETTDKPPAQYPDVEGTWSVRMEVTGEIETTFTTDLVIEQDFASLSTSVRIDGNDIPLVGIVDTEGRLYFIGKHPSQNVHVDMRGTLEDLNKRDSIQDGTMNAYHPIAGNVARGVWVATRK